MTKMNYVANNFFFENPTSKAQKFRKYIRINQKHEGLFTI